MIDTDKYEAYKPTQSNYQTSDRYIKELLAEVKRLRKYAELVADIGDMIYENSNSYELTWDEFNEMLKEMIE